MNTQDSEIAANEGRPHKSRKLSHPSSPETQSNAASGENRSDIDRTVPRSLVLQPISLPLPQEIFHTMPQPITLHERSTAHYPTDIPSPSSSPSQAQASDSSHPIATTSAVSAGNGETNSSSPLSLSTEHIQPSLSAVQLDGDGSGNDSVMTDRNLHVGQPNEYDGMDERTNGSASRQPQPQSQAQSETLANTAATMTRAGAGTSSGPGASSARTNNSTSTATSPSARNGTTAGPSTNTSTSSTANGKHVHHPSGYEWEKEEDAPGYMWKNRKAKEEASRAWDQIVGKDKMIGRKYGDIGLDENQ